MRPKGYSAHRFLVAMLGLSAMLSAIGSTVVAQSFNSVTPLTSLPVSANTGEKPQSKVWTYDGRWFAVLPNSSGTKLWRLDGTTWTDILPLTSATDSHADVKVVGNVAHILLFTGASSSLVSVEYVPASDSYQLWTSRTSTVALTFDSGVETATLDMDSQGRLWIASDASTDINVRWSDSPYSTWSSPITIASGVSTDDICVVTAMGGTKIGVLWSNQNTQRFGFRTHADGADPGTWTADEIPASQSALNVGLGMADDHLNVAAASDGTLYAAVKTSYDTPGNPKMALLVRRPGGTWDNLYSVDEAGTRGIILLNEQLSSLTFVYTTAEGTGNIVYRKSALSPISFGAQQSLMTGSLNESSSTKQNYTNQVVILASSGTTSAVSVLAAEPPAFPADLVAYFPMNEGSGSAIKDSSAYHHNGTTTGSPTWIAGVEGTALSLSGTGQYATVSDTATLDITSGITLAAWVKPGKTGTQYLIKKAVQTGTNGYELSMATTGTFFVRFNQTTSGNLYRLDSKTLYSTLLNTWVHVAATYDGTTMRLYLNGVEDSAKARTVTIATNALALAIGAESNGGSPFQGAMDEVRVYNRALSPVEVAALAATQYTITASAGANGSITPSGAVTVNSGASQQFIITPNPGYHVASLLIDGGSVTPASTYTFPIVTANHTIQATFALDAVTHTITATAGNHGFISPAGSVSVADGANQRFAVTADAGYHVDSLLVDGSPVDSTTGYTFKNVTTDHTIRAVFAGPPDLVVYLPMNEGSGATIRDSSWYHLDGSTAGNPTWTTGYKGAALSLDGSSQYATIPDTISLNITHAITLAAWIKPSKLATQRVIQKGTMNSSNGYELSLSSAGKVFVRLNQFSSSDTIRINSTTSYPTTGTTWMHVAATYDGSNLKLYVNGVQEGGTLVVSRAIGTSTTPLCIGEQFDGINRFGGAIDEARVYNVALTASEIQALMAREFTITASAGSGGSITPSGAVKVDSAATQKFTITPNGGYRVASVLVDGGAVDSTTSYTFKNVTANHTIQANFVLDAVAHTITATASLHGSISPSGAVSVIDGANRSFSITPDAGYRLDTLLVDEIPVDSSASYTFKNVTADHTIRVVFGVLPDLVAYFPMSEGGGSVLRDSSVYKHSGSIQGSPAWISSPRGTGLSFSGSGQYVTVTDTAALDITNAITIAAWVKPAVRGTQDLVKKATNGSVDGYELALAASTGNPPNRPFVRFNQVSGTSDAYRLSAREASIYPVDGTWIHYAATYDGATIKFYINGSLDTLVAKTFTIAINSVPLSIGGQGDGTRSFTGGLDEVRIYNRALSAAEVAALVTGQHTITASAGANGTIDPAGAVTVADGANQSFFLNASTGHHLGSLTVDGALVNPVSPYIFTSVTANHTISASFAADTYPVAAVGPLNIDLTGDGVTDMKVNFTKLPAGGGSLSPSLTMLPPAGSPDPPSGALPYYLTINSSLPGHAFMASVSLDMSGYEEFDAATSLAYYNAGTASWVLIPGTYAASDAAFSGHPSFTFQTDHFTPFVFHNAGTGLKGVYVSAGPSATAGAIYPDSTWGPGTSYGTSDWTWTGSQTVSVRLVPETGLQFGACDLTLEWDPSILHYAGTSFDSAGTPNGIFGKGHSYSVLAQADQLGTQNRVRINCATTDGSNPTTASGDYIARVNFTLVKPGHSAVALIGTDFRAFVQGGPSTKVTVVPRQAEVRAYLADVASTGNGATGDGVIDFQDLAAWSPSYWSGYSGYGLANYKVKYDFGPTQDHTFFSLPVTDRPARIDFEDLMIFSLGYHLSKSSVLPKVPSQTPEPVNVFAGAPMIAGGETHVPLHVAGGVTDVRGMSLVLKGQFGKLLGVEKGALLASYATPVTVMSRAEGSEAFVDLAVMGLDAEGLHGEGEIAVLRFESAAHVNVTSVDCRNSYNQALATNAKSQTSEIPTAFGLEQNYPNPFNPSTTISYGLPVAGDVRVDVYDILGQHITRLVSGVQEAGYHDVAWDGKDSAGRQRASGIYIYRVQAGQYSAAKKMILMK
jgi:large repetitive protein